MSHTISFSTTLGRILSSEARTNSALESGPADFVEPPHQRVSLRCMFTRETKALAGLVVGFALFTSAISGCGDSPSASQRGPCDGPCAGGAGSLGGAGADGGMNAAGSSGNDDAGGVAGASGRGGAAGAAGGKSGAAGSAGGAGTLGAGGFPGPAECAEVCAQADVCCEKLGTPLDCTFSKDCAQATVNDAAQFAAPCRNELVVGATVPDFAAYCPSPDDQ